MFEDQSEKVIFGKKYSNKLKKSSKNRGESNLRTSKADGVPEAAKGIERVLITNPGMGVIRHVDAGYENAIEFMKDISVKISLMK